MYLKWDKKRSTAVSMTPPAIINLITDADCPEFSAAHVKLLESATRGQAENPVWIEQRVSRCTASNFKDICTRMDTIAKQPEIKPTAMVDRIMGCKVVSQDIPALMYGRRMEPVAAQKYIKIQKKCRHRPLKVEECGLFMDSKYPYIGASPDRLISCCCGEGVLEIKCPLSCADKTPSALTVKYLSEEKGVVRLNPKHAYFFQVKGQMAVTGRKWTDFFIFSHKEYYLERIIFDNNFCQDVQSQIVGFWTKYVYPVAYDMSKTQGTFEMEIELSTLDVTAPGSSTNTVTCVTTTSWPFPRHKQQFQMALKILHLAQVQQPFHHSPSSQSQKAQNNKRPSQKAREGDLLAKGKLLQVRKRQCTCVEYAILHA